jgi:hypothetical protein
MRTISKARRRGEILFGLLLAIAVVGIDAIVASDAHAQNLVYHSPNDDGTNFGFPATLPVGPGSSLFLYLDAGSLASQGGTTACSDGDGREICGYEIVVDALGSASFVDFLQEQGVVYGLTPTQAQINGIFSLNPALGAVRIGELKVASSDEDGAVLMKGGTVVLAALQVETVPQVMLATVPEPIGTLPLLAGIMLMSALGRRRARTSG